MLNKKAQMFAPYELLIGAILGLLILAIIISSIYYFDKVKIKTSTERIFDGFKEAVDNIVEQGSTQLVTRDNLLLEDLKLSTAALVQGTEIKSECIAFNYPLTSSVYAGSSERLLSVNGRIEVSVYFQCFSYESQECPIFCNVYVGKKPN